MKGKKNILLLIAIAFILLFTSENVLAQQAGTLKGQIFDLTETGIPRAKVTLGKEGHNHKIKTDPDGKYEITLPAGIYSLIVKADGFLPSRKRQIKITANQVTVENVTMSITRETIGCPSPTPEKKSGQKKEKGKAQKKRWRTSSGT